MFIYADAQTCPGCRSSLAYPGLSCAVCGLALTGPAPQQIFRTLQQVDRLVAEMYAAAEPTPPAGTTEATDAPDQPAVPVGASAGVLSSASVPRILLGLGALCLLIAAVVFLAVAWTALGVEGRTAVLGGLTAIAAGLTSWVARRDLRGGAEALASVTLGLLTLDLGGAWRAGWLGGLAEGPFLVVAGLVVAVAAAAIGRWAATTPVRTLIGVEVIAVLGLLTTAIGVPDTLQRGDAVAALAALVVFAAGAAAGHGLGLRMVAAGSGAAAAICWSVLVSVGVLRLDELSVAHLWGELVVWPLLAATALVAAVGVPRRLPHELRVVAVATAIALGTLVVTAVSFDESPTRLALVELAVIAACAVASTRLPGAWRWVCITPSAIAAAALSAGVLRLAARAVGDLVLNEPWTRGVLDLVDAPDVPWTWPLLLPAGVVGISVTVATLLHCADRPMGAVLLPGAAATGVAGALMPTSYAAPLVLAVAAVAVVTVALAVAGAVLGRVELVAAAVTTTALALLAALASDWLTAALLAAVTGTAVAVALRGSRASADYAPVAGLLAPVTGAGLIWTVGHLAALAIEVRALPALAVLGAVVLVRPAVDRELGAAAAAVLVIGGSVVGPGTVEVSWLAVYLTFVGVVATAASLLDPTRRLLAWVGLACLTLAQWIRLEELGVGTVEAYTLPLALVLLSAGTVALLRDHGSSLRMLTPGLGLALVPTLLLVLVDPLSARAVLLGLACLALLAVGLARGWAAPILAGAAVGGLVVLRQGTLAELLPQWVLIGLVGVVLTTAGVTWEQRLQELRRLSVYVRGLH